MPVIHNHQGHVGTIQQHIKQQAPPDPLIISAQMLADVIASRVRHVPARNELIDDLQKFLNKVRTCEAYPPIGTVFAKLT